ncbi:tether containing UBX domain for GLUT4 [Lutzomyia longipalpis]|uniref:tether containing UBX domain for GLUT4 n=1 Tax=Lutzomyia longipalpis TaxID=7200 RepID=UPI0024846DB3|nr:tether containing UBX domain for GLUT4 [Lutzomyia longipalpis]
MSNQSVTVLTPNGRRQIIKLTPNTTLLEVLEQVCRKFQLEPNKHILRHHNKTVDLSGMFRFSGLPNNCLLEMEETQTARKEAEVHIVLQMESGERLSDDFTPATTIEGILGKLCPDGVGNEKNLVVIYMRKEVFGEELATTTLKSLGLTSGKAMLRLLRRNPEELRVQANVSSVLAPKPIPVAPVEVAKSQNPRENVQKVLAVQEESTEVVEQQPMEVDEEQCVANEEELPKERILGKDSPEMKKSKFEEKSTKLAEKPEKSEALSAEEMKRLEEEIRIIGEHDAVIFSLDSTQRMQERDLPDSFFDLTIDDVRLLLRDLKDQAKSLDDAPLLTAQLREMENNRKVLKLLQYKKTIIRIQFPDRHVLQATFNPIDTIEGVRNVVRKHLENPVIAFYLFTTPPKQILPPNSRLVELQCVPQAVIHFGVEQDVKSDTGSFLRGDLLQNLTSPDAAILLAMRSRGLSPCSVLGKKDGQEDAEMAGASGSSLQKPRIPDNFQKSSSTASSSSSTASTVPKWFKMSK